MGFYFLVISYPHCPHLMSADVMWKCPLYVSILSLYDVDAFQLDLCQCFVSFPNKNCSTSTFKLHQTIIPIIYEDEKLLAICKPPHIPHHDDPHKSQVGILSLIRQQQTQQTFPYSGRLYGVHRLDRVTSGILLFAKDSYTANALTTKFRRKEVRKYYFAISGKKPKKKKQGWVKGEMAIGRRGCYKLLNEKRKQDLILDDEVVGSNDKRVIAERGGYAETRFYTAGLGNLNLSYISRSDESADQCPTAKTAILFEPHTGKTHQLRVAAKSVGLPILGDKRYGGGSIQVQPEDVDFSETDLTAFDRTCLHASAIHFEIEGYNVTVCSPPPFSYLFQEGNGLNDVFVGMMSKYCDCAPILDAISRPNKS